MRAKKGETIHLYHTKMFLVEQLLKKKVLDKSRAAALEYEIKTSGRRPEEILLDKKIVSEDFLFGLKSETLRIPLKVISPEEVQLKVLETIPEESAKYYKIIPLSKEEDRLIV